MRLVVRSIGHLQRAPASRWVVRFTGLSTGPELNWFPIKQSAYLTSLPLPVLSFPVLLNILPSSPHLPHPELFYIDTSISCSVQYLYSLPPFIYDHHPIPICCSSTYPSLLRPPSFLSTITQHCVCFLSVLFPRFDLCSVSLLHFLSVNPSIST